MKINIFNNKSIFKLIIALTSYFTLFSCGSSCTNNNINKNNIEKLIQKSLNTTEKFDIKELEEGISGSRIFVASSNQKKYIIRFLCPKSKNTWLNEIECFNIASEEGYGPKIYFVDSLKGIIIMEYLENEEVPQKEIKSKRIYKYLALILQKIHFGKPFPQSVNIFKKIQNNIELAKTRKNYIPLKELETILNTIEIALSKHLTITPCHLDLGPTNLRFYKNKFKAIDLETAAQFESYYDIAGLANYYCQTPKDETLLLSLYLNRKPTPIEKAKLYLMKQIVLLYGIECIKLFPAMTELLFQASDRISYEKLAAEFSKGKNNSFNKEYGLKMAKISVEYITNNLKTVISNSKSNEFKIALNILKTDNK